MPIPTRHAFHALRNSSCAYVNSPIEMKTDSHAAQRRGMMAPFRLNRGGVSSAYGGPFFFFGGMVQRKNGWDEVPVGFMDWAILRFVLLRCPERKGHIRLLCQTTDAAHRRVAAQLRRCPAVSARRMGLAAFTRSRASNPEIVVTADMHALRVQRHASFVPERNSALTPTHGIAPH